MLIMLFVSQSEEFLVLLIQTHTVLSLLLQFYPILFELLEPFFHLGTHFDELLVFLGVLIAFKFGTFEVESRNTTVCPDGTLDRLLVADIGFRSDVNVEIGFCGDCEYYGYWLLLWCSSESGMSGSDIVMIEDMDINILLLLLDA